MSPFVALRKRSLAVGVRCCSDAIVASSVATKLSVVPTTTTRTPAPSVRRFYYSRGGLESQAAGAAVAAPQQQQQQQQRLPLLPNPPLPPAPAENVRPKSALQRWSDKFSLTGQQNKIRRGESLFQAARRQAADPYVPTVLLT